MELTMEGICSKFAEGWKVHRSRESVQQTR